MAFRVTSRRYSTILNAYCTCPEVIAIPGLLEDSGIEDWVVNSLIELYRFQRSGKASMVSNNVEKITGKKPISFEQFATDYIVSFKTEMPNQSREAAQN
jgi:hypothetical protein